jgi:ADP-ribose pyrophosphatase
LSRPFGPRPEGRRRVLATRRIHAGKVLSLDVDDVQEPGDVRAQREVVRHSGSVAALPVRDDGRLVLVRQYRYAVDESLWELPAGRLEPGEAPEDGIQRELREEIGHEAASLVPLLFFYTTPGFCDERMYVFRAAGLRPAQAPGDDDERIEVGAFTLQEAEAMIARGELREGKTLAAVLHELLHRSPAGDTRG